MTPPRHPAAPGTPRLPDAGQHPGAPARIPRRSFRVTATVPGASVALGSLAACAQDSTNAATSGTGTSSTGQWGDSSVRAAADSDGTVWDSTTVHTISVDMDAVDYAAMLETF